MTLRFLIFNLPDGVAENPEYLYTTYICTYIIQQYRYPNWVEVGEGDVFIDCGAFIGDTAIWALQKGAVTHSFDPIPDNVDLAKKNMELNGFDPNGVYNLAVGSKEQEVTLRVPVNFQSSSYIPIGEKSASAKLHIQQAEEKNEIKEVSASCIRLDDFFKEHDIHPTFIKMDIEGSELDALEGAEETLKQEKPKQAICLYHKDVDLCEIPLYIKSVVPDYKFFCRENFNGGEFVMYATVGDKLN